MNIRINDELRQKLALKWTLAKNKTKIAKDYSLSYSTVIKVLNGETREVRESTYDCLESLANGVPSHKEQKRVALQKQKEQLASLKEKMEKKTTAYPKPTDDGKAIAITTDPIAQLKETQTKSFKEVTSPNSQNSSYEIAMLKQKVGLLEGTVRQIVTAYELNKDLTSQLIEQVHQTTSWMNADTQHSLDNFIKHNEELTKKMNELNDDFDALMKRHHYLTEDNKEIKEKLKKINIKLWPAKLKD
uniref:hypothetical protein n=1 Tax=Lactobacillus acidophilus TaxID=1579 RepID=UPI003F57AF0D